MAYGITLREMLKLVLVPLANASSEMVPLANASSEMVLPTQAQAPTACASGASERLKLANATLRRLIFTDFMSH